MKYKRSDMKEVLLRTGIGHVESGKAVSKIIQSMADALILGKVIELRGLGTFETRERKARMRHDPRNMKPVHVPDRLAIVFKPSENLKKAINGGGNE
jgi:nucleoid DNA-binding protein